MCKEPDAGPELTSSGVWDRISKGVGYHVRMLKYATWKPLPGKPGGGFLHSPGSTRQGGQAGCNPALFRDTGGFDSLTTHNVALTQLVEIRSFKPVVVSSTLTGDTIEKLDQ